jgi:hypothetical protein
VPNFLTEKLGPLPVWGWMGIGTAGILVLVSMRSKSASSTTAATTAAPAASTAAPSSGGGSYGSGYGNYGGQSGGYSWTPAASTAGASTAPASTASTTAPAASSATATTGGSMITVPNVVGTDAGNAHNILVAAGLVPVAAAGQKAYELVTAQSPAPGSQVASGTQVSITAPAGTSLPSQAQTSTTTAGAGQTVVPDCAGQTAGAAHNMLVAAGLTPTAAAGQKATQKCTGTSPAAGTAVAQGSRVTILT